MKVFMADGCAWSNERGRRAVGYARSPEVPRTQSSWRVARVEIRALAGVAALALRPVHTRVVVAARLGAGSAKAGWAWRRWRGGGVGVRGGCGR
ncbi:hypothetical protein GUJ93_ZPchr0012g19068 [Zizania palustris]|nr:hypothetical protein GUJ93_ZPchr0226g7146 [Zizania palustris]KAG8044272.1 hypothetical protein GUJ93_ZPchr0137g29190 [Zizania palustris]KAG8067265.1 hypothetical protein GUJ93_ZPchr0005g16205 [Zizania palustris]KAG8077829.1 hypothetical protein GUJ93_ZPchr0007g3641 [Zizania palustris]KAG8080726.1 hypothetical protein GUJ93_ZPchr0007g5754 [Zizania palustris]